MLKFLSYFQPADGSVIRPIPFLREFIMEAGLKLILASWASRKGGFLFAVIIEKLSYFDKITITYEYDKIIINRNIY